MIRPQPNWLDGVTTAAGILLWAFAGGLKLLQPTTSDALLYFLFGVGGVFINGVRLLGFVRAWRGNNVPPAPPTAPLAPLLLLLLATPTLWAQAPVPPAPLLVFVQAERVDSSSVVFVWGSSPGAVSYNFRLVRGDLVVPPAGTDVEGGVLVWEQRPGTTFVITQPFPGSRQVKAFVRACNAVSQCSAFKVSTPFDFPQTPRPIPPPRAEYLLYGEVTLKNGTLYVWVRDSVGRHELRVTARASTLLSPGLYRGYEYAFTDSAEALLYAAGAMNLARRLQAGTVGDTTFSAGGKTVRCYRVGAACTLTVVNPPATGSWTTSPRVPAAMLLGLAQALRAAALHQVAPYAPGDSLPYKRTLVP